MGQLYKLDFPNGKSYIGITEKTVEVRIKGHICSATNGSKCLVHNAIRKHGIPGVSVLAILENKELLETEIRAIQVFGTLQPNGYNSTKGGDFNPSKLDWVNEKKSVSLKGRKLSESHIDKMRVANKGKKASEQAKKNMSLAGKGKPKSEQHKENIRLASIGRKNSQEAIDKMKASLTGRKNPEQAERMKNNQFWKLRKVRNG